MHIPAGQQLGDLGPAVPQQRAGLVDDEVLLFGPGALLDLGVQVVVPALATLLPQPALQLLSDHTPLLGAVLSHQVHYL